MRPFYALSGLGLAMLVVTLGRGFVESRPLRDEHAQAEACLVPGNLDVGLGEVVANSQTKFTVELSNVGIQPAKLIGAPAVCYKMGCVWVENLPLTILPHQSASVVLNCDAKGPGAMSFNTELLFDVGTGRGVVIPIAISGIVVDPPNP